MDRTISIVRVVTDALAMAFVFVSVLVINLVVQPHHRGFICTHGHVDPGISQPYRDSTVSDVAAIAAVVVIAAVVIILGEILYYIKYRKFLPAYRINICSRQIHPILWNIYSSGGHYAFGLGITVLITEIGKYTVGRLRPHFGSVCLPTLDPTCDGLYIENYTCSSIFTAAQIKDSRVSFPSGHSSSTAFCAVFLSVYLHSRVRQLRGLMRAFIQIVLIILALFTGFSRVMDNKHHPTDVLTGFLIGIAVGIWTIMLFLRGRKERGIPFCVNPDDDPPQQESLASNTPL